jgi:UDP-glucuronate 4-epimerase
MRALVTGAAGFIGSRLCHDLIRSGYDVAGVDALRPYYSTQLKKMRVSEILIPAGTQFHELDLLDYESLNELILQFNPTIIFHLAAQPGVRVPILESHRYIQDNLVAHGNVMKSAVINGVPNVIYASSSSVYGNNSTPPFSEKELKLFPVSVYGSSKLANEVTAPNFVKNSKTRARGLRFFTVYGPWGRPDMAYFRLIASAFDGSPFLLFGDGEVSRDFTFVEDITSMTIALGRQLSEHQAGFSDVVNIGGGAPFRMMDLIKCVESVTGRKINVDQRPANSNDTQFTLASTEYITKLIGKRPETSLDIGISSVVDWASSDLVKEHLRDWVASSK